MNNKPIFRAAIVAAALTAIGAVAAPQTAEAANYYGNEIYESWGSTANLSVNAVGSSWTPWKKMAPNSFSYEWPAFVKNVKCFLVPSGFVAVNTRTGHGYKGPGQYCFSSGFNKLNLLVESNTCWGYRLAGYPCKIYPPAIAPQN